MSTLTLTLLAILSLIAMLLVVAARRPDRFRIQRTALIGASPEKLHSLIDDLRRWQLWSPWEGLDIALARSYQGPERGVGARYAWSGNRKAGAGSIEIVESVPGERVRLALAFERPFAARNDVEFTLLPRDEHTVVVWAMEGPDPYAMRVLRLVFKLDRMVGRDFERGLANLRRVAER